jgi:ABC-type Fe3+/spermidine/putrescine transport system ATPase subunit
VENLLRGTVQNCDGEFAAIELNGLQIRGKAQFPAHSKVVVCIRPDEISLGPHDCGRQGLNQFSGKIVEVTAGIDSHRIILDCDLGRVIAVIRRQELMALGLTVGDQTPFSFDAAAIHVIAAETATADCD